MFLCLISGERGRNVHDISFEEVKGKAKGAGETSQQQVLSYSGGSGKDIFVDDEAKLDAALEALIDAMLKSEALKVRY